MKDEEFDKKMLELNEFSKNLGTFGFGVKYTASEPNIRIHEAFARFAHEEANDEYLMAIGKLLEYADILKFLFGIEEKLSVLEYRMSLLEQKPVKEENKETKTF